MTRPPATPIDEEPTPKILSFNPMQSLTLRAAHRFARTLSLEDLMALLLYFGSRANRTVNQIAREVKKMNDTMEQMNESQMNESLASPIVALAEAYSKAATLMQGEVVNIRSKLKPDADEAIWTSLASISALLMVVKGVGTTMRSTLEKIEAEPPSPAPAAAAAHDPEFLPSSF